MDTGGQHKNCSQCGEAFYRRTEGRWPERDHEWRGRRFCGRRCAFHYASASQGAELGRFGPHKKQTESPAEIGSKALLIRSIQYGLKHDSDLGMGYHAFMARAQELGLAA